MTTTEIDYISRAKQGEGLLMVSNFERHLIKIEASLKEREAYGI